MTTALAAPAYHAPCPTLLPPATARHPLLVPLPIRHFVSSLVSALRHRMFGSSPRRRSSDPGCNTLEVPAAPTLANHSSSSLSPPASPSRPSSPTSSDSSSPQPSSPPSPLTTSAQNGAQPTSVQARNPTPPVPPMSLAVKPAALMLRNSRNSKLPANAFKSPRNKILEMIPHNAVQQMQMDLLLLQESPSRDFFSRAAWNGCSPANRAQVWRMLVDYEPFHYSRRAEALEAKRTQYRHFVTALYAPRGTVSIDCASHMCSAEVHHDDSFLVDHHSSSSLSINHPSPPYARRSGASYPITKTNSNRRIVEYSSLSAKTLRQIEMDLPRTHPDIPIFHVDEVRNPMRRILYIFGMLHPHYSYVQGMNEVLTPILVVFLSNYLHQRGSKTVDAFLGRTHLHGVLTDAEVADAEADAFWTFSALLSAIGDNYAHDQPGIIRRIALLEFIVSQVEPKLATHLAQNGNDYLQFAFRWINCLLMRELPFRLVVKLWDALLARHDGLADFHVYVCAALITRFSDQLMHMDFEGTILFLQNLPTSHWESDDIDVLLSQALIWQETLGLNSGAQ